MRAEPSAIPVIINSFNRLACLERLHGWLRRHGTRCIVVLDNASDYPPLLAFHRRIEREGTTVVRLGENVGSLALWDTGQLRALGITTEYVYTDSDVVPAGFCPADAIAHLQRVLRAHPGVRKVGLGLRLDNLPDHYRHRHQALLWERQFWRRPAAPGLMFASVDTTFALYRPGAGHELGPGNLRTTHPYLADHLGWHVDDHHPSEEDRHYLRTARPDVTTWNAELVREELAAGLAAMRTPRLLQLGNGDDAWPGWEQGDRLDLAMLPEASFDGFDLGVPGSLGTMQALHRLAKPNARMLVWVADAGFDPRAALAFGSPAHAGSTSAYAGDWAISAIHRFPASGRWLVHLYAVKPPRARARSLEVWSEPRDAPTGLSPEPAFDTV